MPGGVSPFQRNGETLRSFSRIPHRAIAETRLAVCVEHMREARAGPLMCTEDTPDAGVWGCERGRADAFPLRTSAKRAAARSPAGDENPIHGNEAEAAVASMFAGFLQTI